MLTSEMALIEGRDVEVDWVARGILHGWVFVQFSVYSVFSLF